MGNIDSSEFINPKIEKLKEAIEKSNKISSCQNKIMIALTVAILIATIVMIVKM